MAVSFRRRDVQAALVLGAALAAVGVGALLRLPQRADALLQIGVHLAAGREAAIPAGLGAGLSWGSSALLAVWLEWSMLLLGFPLLVLFGRRLHRIAKARAALERAEAFARRRPDAGVLVLGAITLMPFLPIGALTSLLVGETLGLPSVRLLFVLAGAELAANVTVALAAASVIGYFPDPAMAGFALAGFMLVLGLVLGLLPRRLQSSM